MKASLVPCLLAHFGGKLVRSEQALIRADNHALHYGTAGFESFRVYETSSGPALLAVARHLERLRLSLLSLGMAAVDMPEVEAALSEMVIGNGLREAYLRLLVYPAGDCGRLDHSDYGSQIILLGWHVEGPRYGDPISLTPAGLRRPPASCLLPRAKLSGFYAAYASAHVSARAQGFDDALILHADGTICEVTGANIFLVKDDTIFTPVIPHSIDGITRRLVLEIAARLGIPVKETIMPPEDLIGADESFISGTFYGIRAISSVARHRLRVDAPGPVTRAVQGAFDDMLNEPESDMGRAWLSIIRQPQQASLSDCRQGFRIREAQEGDIPHIVAGIESLLAELRAVPGVSLPPGAVSVCQRTINGRLPGAVFVAEPTRDDGRLMGLISLTIQEAIHAGGPYALIQDLWVDKQHRRHGVGAALIEAVEGYCRDQKLKNLEVCLPSRRFSDLPRTKAFYESCGFNEVGPRMRKEAG